jgi:hypothetical protein
VGRPYFFVENFYSTIQFPGHVVSASSEAPGAQAWRVATGRRSAFDRWAPVGFNAPAWLRVTCDVARTVNTVALDRSHNLTGRRFWIQASNDGFAADVRTVVDQVLPLAPAAASSLEAGALTTEGAFLRRVAPVVATSFRLYVPALGANARPEVMGLWLGAGWQPGEYFDLPFDDASVDLRYSPTITSSGWVGAGRAVRGRTGEIGLKLRSAAEYSSARYHIEHGFWRARPMWIVFDDAAAERALLAFPPEGRYGFAQESGWAQRQARIAWTEHEPAGD